MTNDPFMTFARVMLGFFISLGILSIILTIRVLLKKPDLSPAKVRSTTLSVWFSLVVLIPAAGVGIRSMVTHEYWNLFASALLFSYALPLIVSYFRVRAALTRNQ